MSERNSLPLYTLFLAQDIVPNALSLLQHVRSADGASPVSSPKRATRPTPSRASAAATPARETPAIKDHVHVIATPSSAGLPLDALSPMHTEFGAAKQLAAAAADGPAEVPQIAWRGASPSWGGVSPSTGGPLSPRANARYAAMFEAHNIVQQEAATLRAAKAHLEAQVASLKADVAAINSQEVAALRRDKAELEELVAQLRADVFATNAEAGSAWEEQSSAEAAAAVLNEAVERAERALAAVAADRDSKAEEVVATSTALELMAAARDEVSAQLAAVSAPAGAAARATAPASR